ncbi:MAG: hypothetical protein WCW16_05440 [Candidatus Magasanikbacteria bacterium]
MDHLLIEKLLHLKEGDKIKINGRLFTIHQKSFHSAVGEYHGDITTYDLENNFVLELEGERRHFFQIIEKKHWLGFTSARSRVEKIESIEIIK